MPATRPYFARFRGAIRIVDGTSISAVRKHILKPEIDELESKLTECRPATAQEVASFARDGGVPELCGQYPEPKPEAPPEEEQVVDPVYDGKVYAFSPDFCPTHVASDEDAKVCRNCGTHIDELRPDQDQEEQAPSVEQPLEGC